MGLKIIIKLKPDFKKSFALCYIKWRLNLCFWAWKTAEKYSKNKYTKKYM